MNKRLLLSFVIVAGATFGGACRPAAAQWHDNPPVKQLYERAKAERSVTVWGPHVLEVEWIPAAFDKMFPGIEVKFLGDNDVGTKAVAEYRAGRHEIDVFMTSFSAGRALQERNMYAKVDWSIFNIPEEGTALDGRAGLTHNLVYSVVYNKNLVKPGELPKQWTDLLDPKYKDKMVASSFLLPRLIGPMGILWGEDRMAEFARQIVQTGILLTRAPPQNFLQTGERLYAIGNFESQAKMWARQGLPVDFVIPQPVVAPQFYAAVMDKAPHPNAARLLAGYLATPEGKQAGEAHNHQGDYRKSSDHPISKQIWGAGAPVIFDKIEEMSQHDAFITKANGIISGQTR